MSKPTPIRTLLHSLISARGWAGRVAVHQVFLLWEELVGPDIARHAQPYLIRKDILWLRVSDSVWMQQLQFLKIMLLDKINGRLPKGQLSDLRFQLDSSLGQESVGGDEPARPAPLAPSPAERQEFERLLDGIADREIQAAIRRCWLATGRLRQGRESGP